MIIDESALQHWIDNFYGYGAWSAPIWLVSFEESGGDTPEEVADKLNYFHRLNPSPSPALCNIRDAYRHVRVGFDGPKAELFTNMYEFRFDSNAQINGVWKNLIMFTHSYRNELIPDILDYQKKSFASVGSSEALLKLYPLPSPHNHGWYYSWLDLTPQFKFLKTRGAYEQHLYSSRIEQILKNIAAYKPNLVLMYGMSNINALKNSVQHFFGSVKFKAIKAIKQHIPQHHRAELGETTLVITTQIPALRHGRLESGFDWMQFGKRLRESTGD